MELDDFLTESQIDELTPEQISDEDLQIIAESLFFLIE